MQLSRLSAKVYDVDPENKSKFNEIPQLARPSSGSLLGRPCPVTFKRGVIADNQRRRSLTDQCCAPMRDVCGAIANKHLGRLWRTQRTCEAMVLCNHRPPHGSWAESSLVTASRKALSTAIKSRPRPRSAPGARSTSMRWIRWCPGRR